MPLPFPIMDVLKQACDVISGVIEVVEVCMEGGHYSKQWKSDLRFCSTLESTLVAIVVWDPDDQNFTYNFELFLLIQAISPHLQNFYNVLDPSIPTLHKMCNEHHDTMGNIDQLEGKVEDMVRQPLKALRKEVQRFLQAIDTLLLLYIIAVMSSPPFELMSEEQLTELQSIGRRAKVKFTHDLYPSPIRNSPRPLGIEEQQIHLISMRRDTERQWSWLQLTIHGAFGDVAHLSENNLSSTPGSDSEAVRVKSSNENQCGNERLLRPQKSCESKMSSDTSVRHPTTQSRGPVSRHLQPPPSQEDGLMTSNAMRERPDNGAQSFTPSAPTVHGSHSVSVGGHQVSRRAMAAHPDDSSIDQQGRPLTTSGNNRHFESMEMDNRTDRDSDQNSCCTIL